jgi:hypothetical protein
VDRAVGVADAFRVAAENDELGMPRLAVMAAGAGIRTLGLPMVRGEWRALLLFEEWDRRRDG